MCCVRVCGGVGGGGERVLYDLGTVLWSWEPDDVRTMGVVLMLIASMVC